MSAPRMSLNPSILIAPLDWGLGHATRCIPIIRTVLNKNCSVLLAGEGATKNLLQKEFPDLSFVDLKGYRINYSKNKWSLPFMIGKQIPKILSAIQYENHWLMDIVRAYDIDGIISDNRYGLYHETIPSVFITHQLAIKTFLGRAADGLIQSLNYKYINRFTECWVPDNEGIANLAGDLSHPLKKPSIPLQYIGPLSRFQRGEEGTKHILVLLSGPEPQRTLLENRVIADLKKIRQPVILVRGLPGQQEELKLPPNILVFNHLPAAELNQYIAEASVVIGRSGYSTVMDLMLLQKKSILIPTPGQTEQLYLARHLMENNFALCIDQDKFRLANALDLAHSFHYRLNDFHPQFNLETALGQFLKKLK